MQDFTVFLLFVGAFCQNVNQSPTNLGDDQNIERPCDVFDLQCIRRYFVKHAHCKPKYGPVPDPLYRPQTKAYVPRVNLTVDFKDVIYRGLNGRIEEFYVNRETDKVVLAVEFHNLYTATNSSYWRFHRRAREPIITKDYFYINYKSISVTTVILQRKNLQLHRAEQFTFVDETLPDMGIGPRAFGYPDPTVQAARVEFMENTPLNIVEAQLTEGAFYITTFIQYTLCDFGLQLI